MLSKYANIVRILAHCTHTHTHHADYDNDDDHVVGEARALTRGADGNLAVAVLLSAGDAHEIVGLQTAKVGTLRLAVVRESFQRATRAILKDRGINDNKNSSGDGGDRSEADKKRDDYPAAKASGVSALSTATGTLGTVLRCVLGSRGLHDKNKKKNATGVCCLVLYCKFPGGVVACPLGGASFRLREGVGGGVRGSVSGAPGASRDDMPVRVELSVRVRLLCLSVFLLVHESCSR